MPAAAKTKVRTGRKAPPTPIVEPAPSEGECAVRMACSLIRHLPTEQVVAAIPILSRYADQSDREVREVKDGADNKAERKPERTFSLTGDDLDFLDDVVSGHSVHDIESPAGSELATFIHNIGDADDRAEMLILLLPIARRVFKLRQ